MRSLFTGALLVVLVAACSDGDSAEKASVAALSAEERGDVATGSMGTFDASLVLAVSLAEPSQGCPAVSVSASGVTITGGCTDTEGIRWDGKITSSVKGSGLSLSVEDFKLVMEETTVTVDGDIQWTGTGIASDIVIAYPGKEMIISSSWTTTSLLGGSVRIAGDSRVEIEGIGYVDTAGEWDLRVPSGYLELRGEQTLRIDFTTYVEGCASATLDGAASGEVCVSAGLLARPSPLSLFQEKMSQLAKR